jgi:hypothetical protein
VAKLVAQVREEVSLTNSERSCTSTTHSTTSICQENSAKPCHASDLPHDGQSAPSFTSNLSHTDRHRPQEDQSFHRRSSRGISNNSRKSSPLFLLQVPISGTALDSSHVQKINKQNGIQTARSNINPNNHLAKAIYGTPKDQRPPGHVLQGLKMLEANVLLSLSNAGQMHATPCC